MVKGFGIVNKAEIDVFLELSCFLDDPADVGNLISGRSRVCTSWQTGEEHFRQRKVKAGAQQGRRGQCGPMKAVEARLVGFSKNHRIEYDFYFR